MFKKLLHALSLLCLALSVQAQDLKVTGIVRDETGSPLPGVTIIEKGLSSNGTTSTSNGIFTITLKGSSKTLLFSFVGYLSREVNVSGRNNVNITMSADSKSLKDVVVIGYQEVSRKKNTAAIASVKGDVIKDIPAPSFDMLLQGRVAGVNVQNFSGEPGVRNSFVVRGNTSVLRGYDAARAVSSPLFVIDGIPTTTDDISQMSYGQGTNTNLLAGLNPNDIESIDVLKDASAAAIYGSRGSNGVIIIKTRKAHAGKAQFNFSTYHGMSEQRKLTELVTGAEERRMKLDVLNQYNQWEDNYKLPQMLTDSLNPTFNNNTDWQGLFYQRGMIHNYDMSISGGTELVNYRVSLGHYNEEGILKNTGFKRYSMISNVSIQITPKLSNRTIFRLYRTDRPRSVNERTGGNFSFKSDELPSSFYRLTPAGEEFLVGNSRKMDKNINNSMQLSTVFNYVVLPSLLFNTTVSYETSNSNRDYYSPAVVRDNGFGFASSFADKSEHLTIYNTLEYTKKLGQHTLNLIGGQNMEYNAYRNTYADADFIASDYVNTVNTANKNFSTASSAFQEYGLQSLFARVNYDFKAKYLLSAVFNADASSKFGKNNRWGYFPSVSAGWIISDESFMKGTSNWLSYLKIRGSYGITGSQPQENYLGYNTYTVNAAKFGDKDNSPATTYNGGSVIIPNYSSGIAQRNLSWEQSIQSNIGLEATFLKDRIRLTVDAYSRGTSRGFFDYRLPIYSGYDLAKTNAIGIRNAGVELMINSKNLPDKSAVQWFTDFNISYNQNVITSLPNGGRSLIVSYDGGAYGFDYLLDVGKPVNQMFVFENRGVYSRDSDVPFNYITGQPLKNVVGVPYKAGDPIIVDQVGNFNIKEPMDQIVGGDPNPKYTGGINNTISYKGFSFSFFLTFTMGRQILNSYKIRRYVKLFDGSGDNGETNLARGALFDLSKVNYWKKPGDIADIPSLSLRSADRDYHYAWLDGSTMYIENGSYCRLKNISLNYSFNPRVLKTLRLNRLRVYGIMDNVFTLQRSTVPDAEAVNAYGIYDGDGYPIPTKFTLGIDLGF
ncbi:SusC/RagA family TonB-linked outer membrane protein [Chitinophaga flava]|uniref:SusC/RagA family TonB-linked outer membrane protein n=1 Tax=Chitinophaga flava TaxID=2259036 RepID=A0A365XZ48_9BACT|nr:SusC/RagA family TonB-linked outer membrane protein [Chitinophaga flava]RBL91622.1 SusC/RagA family TonB-linked outer membrane protein [Chitinophaga flava]